MPNRLLQRKIVFLSTAEDHTLTFGDRVRIYRNSLISPETALGPAFRAAIGQWEDTPPEWREDGEGYGLRFASGLGRHVISQSIESGLQRFTAKSLGISDQKTEEFGLVRDMPSYRL